MKQISKIEILKLNLVFWSVMLLWCGCSEEKDASYVPQTELGKQLVEQSGIIDDFYSDRSFNLRDGIDITELTFLIREDRQHIFISKIDLTKVTFTPGNPTDENKMPTSVAQDAIIPVHAVAAENHGKKVWLGVNGDFYSDNPYFVMGLYYKDGVKLNDKAFKDHEAVLYMLKNGEAYAGVAEEALAYGDQLYHALGGYGTLIKGGVVNMDYENIGSLATGLNPRTSAGLSQDRKTLYLFTVDGRRKDSYYANGTSLKDLALLMKAVDCYDAINLDGGGSTTLVVREIKEDGVLSFPVLNTPADDRVPRKVSNSLLIIEKK